MKLKEGLEARWEELHDKNMATRYGNAAQTFMEKWADLMESKIEEREYEPAISVITDCAEELARKADSGLGITGFMYNYAVKSLAYFWVYGEQLRQWHNRRYDYDGDGVVNSSMITILTD